VTFNQENSAQAALKAWVSPEVKKLSAGSAEAISINGNPDGGGVGNSRS
jgi:hypothetical protein